MLTAFLLLLVTLASVHTCDIPSFRVSIKKKTSNLPNTVFHSPEAIKDAINFKAEYQNIPVLCKKMFAGTNLDKIHIETCNVKEIEAKTFYGLSTSSIEILFNSIETIGDVFDNPKLTNLDLNSNKIRRITANAFSKLPELTKINLRNNELSSVDANWFKSNRKLQLVNLRGNQIIHIPQGFFKAGNKKLVVHLLDNPIDTIADGAFTNVDVLTLNLYHTKLRKLSNMFKGVGAVDNLIIDSNQIGCSGQKNLNNLKVVKYLHIQKDKWPTNCYKLLDEWAGKNQVGVKGEISDLWKITV